MYLSSRLIDFLVARYQDSGRVSKEDLRAELDTLGLPKAATIAELTLDELLGIFDADAYEISPFVIFVADAIKTCGPAPAGMSADKWILEQAGILASRTSLSDFYWDDRTPIGDGEGDRPNEPAMPRGANDHPLTDTDVQILECLAKRKGIIAAVVDIAVADPKTVRPRLKYLKVLGYVAHPPGKTRGWLITDMGTERLSALPAVD